MSSSDSRTRYANTNANARISRPSNWGSDPSRDYRPVGQRYGSVLVLSGPKRKQSVPGVRKPIPRPVNLPSQRKDRFAEGSLLGSKQSRTDESQPVENATHSLNSHSWHNPSGTWNTPPDNSSRTDEYGFPIRSEAPINSREFPTLAASKHSAPSKQRTQQDEADAFFSLDDRDAFPPSKSSERTFGSQREDHRPDNRQDWRSARSNSHEGERLFRDDSENRLFSNNRSSTESRRGAFGFHSQDADRSRSGVPQRVATRGRQGSDNGSSAFGRPSQTAAGSSRIEDYGLRPGSAPNEKAPTSSKPQDDYVGTSALGVNSVFSSTLLAAGVAPAAIARVGRKEEEADSEEDAELEAHYKELELIKAEEEEKDRQRVLAQEAPTGADAASLTSRDEDGVGDEGGCGSWEDAADESSDAVPADEKEHLGLKPVDHAKWAQRQAEIEAEDRDRRERAAAKKRELEDAISRREEEKSRAAREASEAAMAALAAANTPLPAAPPQAAPSPSSRSNTVAGYQITPPPPPPQIPRDSNGRAADPGRSIVFTDSSAQEASIEGSAPAMQGRRQDFMPAPTPLKPAWGQALYAREGGQVPDSLDEQASANLGSNSNKRVAEEDAESHSQQEKWGGSRSDTAIWRDELPTESSTTPGVSSQTSIRDGTSSSHDQVATRELRAEDGGGRSRGRRGKGGDGGRNGTRSRHQTGEGASNGGAIAHAPSRMSTLPGSCVASDANAAAVAAAAKVAKAMEKYALPSLPTPAAGRKAPVDMMHFSVNGVNDGVAPVAGEGQASPAPPHSSQPVFESPYNSAVDLMPSSSSVAAMDQDEKGNGLFDGTDMGENLLPSNILGIDDAPYPASKPSQPNHMQHHHQLLSMPENTFTSSLDQNKNLSPISHCTRPFTSSDHGNVLPLGSGPAFAPHQQQNVRDRLPDQSQLWAVSQEWESPSQPPLHPPANDLRLHHPSFGMPASVAPSYSPSKRHQQHASAPTSRAVASVYGSTFGYPTPAVFSMPTFPQNSQMHVPLVPTSKPPDWSNNGPASVGWSTMPTQPTPQQPRPVASLHTNMQMPDAQTFQMQDPPNSARNSFVTQGSSPLPSNAHSAVPQQRQFRMSDLEMKLPDNLGLGSSPQTHSARAPSRVTQGGLGSRSARGNRGRNGDSHNSRAAGDCAPIRSDGGNRGRNSGHGHGGSETERLQGQANGGGGGGRSHGRRSTRARGGGHSRRGRERGEPTAAPLVPVE